MGVAALATVAERHNDVLAGSSRAVAEGFSLALVVAAALLALAAVLIAAGLRIRRMAL